MTQTTLKPIVLSILLISAPILSQAHETDQSVDLDEVTVVGKSRPRATSGLLHTSTASDKIISGDTLRQKAVNLGDALDGVPGIHASQYGGGASAPVIRGQTGRRIKVLNHHGETGDMADFSPDHALIGGQRLVATGRNPARPGYALVQLGQCSRFGRCCRWQNPRKNA